MMLDCDLLTVYSNLCIGMPDMQQCDMWKALCKEIPDWPLCSNDNPDSNAPPQMKMYFHTGIVDYVLFKGWVPRTAGSYIGTWIIIFVAAVLSEILKLTRALLEKRWKRQQKKAQDMIGLDEQQGMPQYLYSQMQVSFRLSVDLPRAILQALEVGWSLLIMLVAMTFNVGLFFAVILGSFAGTLMVGRFFDYEAKAVCH